MVSGLLAVEGWCGETSDSLLIYSVGRNCVCAVEDAARRADSWLELCLKELLNKIKEPKHADMHCRSDHCHKEFMKPKKGVEL